MSDSIFDYYKNLIALRKDHPAIIDGDFQFQLIEHPQLVVYTRSCAREKLLVVANFSNEPATLELPAEITSSKWELLLSNTDGATAMENGLCAPWQAEIYALTE